MNEYFFYFSPSNYVLKLTIAFFTLEAVTSVILFLLSLVFFFLVVSLSYLLFPKQFCHFRSSVIITKVILGIEKKLSNYQQHGLGILPFFQSIFFSIFLYHLETI